MKTLIVMFSFFYISGISSLSIWFFHAIQQTNCFCTFCFFNFRILMMFINFLKRRRILVAYTESLLTKRYNRVYIVFGRTSIRFEWAFYCLLGSQFRGFVILGGICRKLGWNSNFGIRYKNLNFPKYTDKGF